jgi:hypothetical protein
MSASSFTRAISYTAQNLSVILNSASIPPEERRELKLWLVHEGEVPIVPSVLISWLAQNKAQVIVGTMPVKRARLRGGVSSSTSSVAQKYLAECNSETCSNWCNSACSSSNCICCCRCDSCLFLVCAIVTHGSDDIPPVGTLFTADSGGLASSALPQHVIAACFTSRLKEPNIATLLAPALVAPSLSTPKISIGDSAPRNHYGIYFGFDPNKDHLVERARKVGAVVRLPYPYSSSTYYAVFAIRSILKSVHDLLITVPTDGARTRWAIAAQHVIENQSSRVPINNPADISAAKANGHVLLYDSRERNIVVCDELGPFKVVTCSCCRDGIFKAQALLNSYETDAISLDDAKVRLVAAGFEFHPAANTYYWGCLHAILVLLPDVVSASPVLVDEMALHVARVEAAESAAIAEKLKIATDREARLEAARQQKIMEREEKKTVARELKIDKSANQAGAAAAAKTKSAISSEWETISHISIKILGFDKWLAGDTQAAINARTKIDTARDTAVVAARTRLCAVQDDGALSDSDIIRVSDSEFGATTTFATATTGAATTTTTATTSITTATAATVDDPEIKEGSGTISRPVVIIDTRSLIAYVLPSLIAGRSPRPNQVSIIHGRKGGTRSCTLEEHTNIKNCSCRQALAEASSDIPVPIAATDAEETTSPTQSYVKRQFDSKGPVAMTAASVSSS